MRRSAATSGTVRRKGSCFGSTTGARGTRNLLRFLARLLGLGDETRDAEVDDLYFATGGEDDVAGLEIAVDDAGAMRELESTGDGEDDGEE